MRDHPWEPIAIATITAMLGSQLGAIASTALAPQTFRAGVDNVAVYATVTNRSGEPVTTLTVDDFEVKDNGRRQPIALYSLAVQPITIAILLDRSPSLFDVAARSQAAAMEFIRRLGPGDRAALGTFAQRVSLESELTGDLQTLVRRLGGDDTFPAGTAVWDAIEAGRLALANEPGRRVILIITDAADNCSRTDLSSLRTSLQRDGVLVYVLGLRGREGLQEHEISAIARMTGGASLELRPSTDLGAAMQRVADELHRQYVLGFSPRALDDKVHEIQVRVARDDVVVRARRSYIASSHGSAR